MHLTKRGNLQKSGVGEKNQAEQGNCEFQGSFTLRLWTSRA